MMSSDHQTIEQAPRWRALEPTARRVLGVLIEKAKTTPENYPLSLNALRAGCNQKNNRAPLMQLEEPQIEEALDDLRQLGAVALVQGGGRVDRYRHLAYDWLGVDKVQLAVMAELLLRGAQTVGELRGRAARMEPIKDLADLQPTLDALKSKGLVIFLTPPGRGSIVSHALFLDRELDKVRREASGEAGGEPASARADSAGVPLTPPMQPSAAARPSTASGTQSSAGGEMDRLREEIAALKRDFQSNRADFESTLQALRHELDELRRQLSE